TSSTAAVNVTLEAGTISEAVSVVSETSLLNTETGTTTTTVTERQIQDIPLNNRSVLDLAVTAPNVTGDVGSEDPGVTSDQPVPGFNLNVNGVRSSSTTILADVINNMGIRIPRTIISFKHDKIKLFNNH